MKPAATTVYDQLRHHVLQTSLLGSVESLLGWDERCLMPDSAAEYRAEQMTLLAGMIHDRQTAPQLGQWLADLADSPLATNGASETGATIRQVHRQYLKKVKLPKSLVEELTRTAVLGQQAWQQARRDDDFNGLAPLLDKTVRLKREQAEAAGYAETPYDALLDDFEPGEVTANVARVLSGLRDELVPLAAEILGSGRKPNSSLLTRHFPAAAQEAFGREVATAIGFDFGRGRLDVTAHPFCSSVGPNDCRITTRYDERYFNSAFFGTLHEAGHGIYEQGLPTGAYGLPPGEAASMGIHESQSRMWENFVGRGLPFWRHFFPAAQRAFPLALGNVPLDEFYFAVNDVRASLIRVEADEATYNLHILIRFELEQDLIADRLRVGDLPAAWNEKYRAYLGVEPPNDADGVLQDIHWSAGLFGYFATYSLGNLYAAQFFAQAAVDLGGAGAGGTGSGGLSEQLARGEFAPLREWLLDKIHRHGQCYAAGELVERVTGRPLGHDALISHLRGKLGPLYGLQ
ncbi:MAG TPA: carboxypeptidase M32 [Pirellulales bacterium]|jgi:carboxypeptidase Taq|nr:carboxypeptidase M32 [Pirellulales bacterium]